MHARPFSGKMEAAGRHYYGGLLESGIDERGWSGTPDAAVGRAWRRPGALCPTVVRRARGRGPRGPAAVDAQAEVPDNVVGWAYRVVRNGAISASRAARRRERRHAAAAQQETPWFEPSPGERLDAETATAALRQLPIEQRETIVARLWGGLTFQEIADLTGSSTSTVHRCYQAGLTALRERLSVPCPKKQEKQRLDA